MSLDDVVSVQISVNARAATRAGFGVPLIAAYHNHWVDRVRSYTSAGAMVSDGFKTWEPAYLAAAAIFSQRPRVRRVKIGRRDGAPAQVVDITPGASPSTGDVHAITVDGVERSYTAAGGDVLATVCTGLAADINTAIALDADSIIATGGTTGGLQTLTGALLDGVIGDDDFDQPMRLEFVFSSHADWNATTITVTGTNSRGSAMSETFIVPDNGAATVVGVKWFASVVSVSIPAQGGTGGTFTLGNIARADSGKYDAIIESGGSTGGIQTLTGASLDGSTGTLTMDPPRALVLVTSSHANWDATTLVVHGTDVDGEDVSENFAIPNNGGTTVLGTQLFATVTSVVVPLQSGTLGKFTLGYQARGIADGTSGTKVVYTTTSPGVVVQFDGWRNTQGGDDLLTITDQTANPSTSIAVDLAAMAAADKDWYGVLLDSNSKAQILAAAAWTETERKLLVIQSADSATMDSGSTTDVFASLATLGYARTVPMFHPSIGVKWEAAAIVGNRFPRDPGSDTWNLKTLRGVSVYSLTDTEQTALAAKFATVYVVIAGLSVTQGGKTSANEWVDTTRFVDWLQARMQERIFTILANAEKIPFTDASVDMFVAEIEAQLGDGVRVGGLVKGTISASGPLVADVDDAEKVNRNLPDLAFGGTLAGAIHTLQITGTVSV